MTRNGNVPTPAAGPGEGRATVTYVFAVSRGCTLAALADVAGQPGGGPVRLLSLGTLEAVVQDVPEADFSEAAFRERLSDPAQLERCARAHHSVVTAASQAAPALPLPLATLYLSDERVLAALSGEEDRFHTALRRITGRAEWGVKVYTRARAPEPSCASTPGREPTQAPDTRPGHAYLERLRGARREREQRQEAGLKAAEAVDRAVRAVAVASRRLRSHDSAGSRERGAQLLNAAYLVPHERGAVVATLVERLRGDPAYRDVEVCVTGPWVPYSFVEEGVPDARR
jgi:hypothetical protein